MIVCVENVYVCICVCTSMYMCMCVYSQGQRIMYLHKGDSMSEVGLQPSAKNPIYKRACEFIISTRLAKELILSSWNSFQTLH